MYTLGLVQLKLHGMFYTLSCNKNLLIYTSKSDWEKTRGDVSWQEKWGRLTSSPVQSLFSGPLKSINSVLYN